MYKPEISKNHAALHDLIERWNKACDETYIVSGRDKFWMTHRAAEALAQWYETQFRKNRTFKYEERMRYWRMVAAKELDKTAGQSTNGVFHTHPASGPYTVSHVVTHTIHPSVEKRHRTLKVSVLTPPTLGLEG